MPVGFIESFDKALFWRLIGMTLFCLYLIIKIIRLTLEGKE